MNVKKLYAYIDEPIHSLRIEELISVLEDKMHSKYIARYEAAIELESLPISNETKINIINRILKHAKNQTKTNL